MSLELFDKICSEVKDFTNEIYYHIIGDPCVLSNLNEYLNISYKHNLKVNITTSGFYIDPTKFELLTHKAIKQINFSLNSFNANDTKKSFDEYIDTILDFCKYKINCPNNIFINLRLWNLDSSQSANEYNTKVFSKIQNFFGIEYIDISKDNIRVDNKVLVCFDEYFEWPSLNNTYVEENGYCLGLKSHIGITNNGIVVPCCLDKDVIINLGDLKTQSLKDILKSQKATNIINGFKNHIAVEALCKKCTYKKRFNDFGS